MQFLAQALLPWHDFYVLLGQASATMTGLLFVAASVGSGVFSTGRRGALRMFLSASVVQFVCILAACLLVLVPGQGWRSLGIMIAAGGLFGIAYSAMAWRDALRDGLVSKIDLEDRLWYAAAPALGYALESGAGLALLMQHSFGCAALAAAMGILLVVAIHNAWDITVWSLMRRDK